MIILFQQYYYHCIYHDDFSFVSLVFLSESGKNRSAFQQLCQNFEEIKLFIKKLIYHLTNHTKSVTLSLQLALGCKECQTYKAEQKG